MKKLMVALAAVVLAASTQAASVKWSSGTMKLPDADGKQSANATTKITGSLYIINAATYATLLDGLSDADTFASTVTTMYTEANKGTYGAAAKTSATAKGVVVLTDGANYENTTVYGLLLYTYAESADKTWAIANVGSVEVETADQTATGMGLYVGNATSGTAMTWTAVPEPTSGLLVLLGMAGLALRRKNA